MPRSASDCRPGRLWRARNRANGLGNRAPGSRRPGWLLLTLLTNTRARRAANNFLQMLAGAHVKLHSGRRKIRSRKTIRRAA